MRVLATSQDQVELRRRLCLYLSVMHPTKGIVPGPYSKIGSPLRRLFLDVARESMLEGGDEDELARKVSASVIGTPEEEYWTWHV